jgi:hypothetical protein
MGLFQRGPKLCCKEWRFFDTVEAYVIVLAGGKNDGKTEKKKSCR